MEFSHLDDQGNVHMVDVGAKVSSRRRARAEGSILMRKSVLNAIANTAMPKGDVLQTARIAGLMAAKRTAELIPLCHSVPLTHAALDFVLDETGSALHCTSQVETFAQTGVEMEALTAVQIALLTIYDMCKSADRAMRITNVRLLEKSGGRSGTWRVT